MPLNNSLKKVLIALLLIVVFAAVFIAFKVSLSENVKMRITTEKKEYKAGDILKINIENNLKEKICFSSCYPYYIERKGERNQWKSYSYGNCGFDDLAEKCLGSGKKKGFEIIIPFSVEKGPHRLNIPACQNCEPGSKFVKENWSHSNKFIIK